MQINPKGPWNAVVTTVSFLLLTSTSHANDTLYLLVDRESGSASVIPSGDFQFDGYTISSPSGLLDPAGWSSLADQNAVGWAEANPRDVQLAEFNWEGSGDLLTGQPVAMGIVYKPAGIFPSDEDLAFQFSTPSGEIGGGGVRYIGASQVPGITVNRETGLVELFNPLGFEITAYTITSESGSLAPDSFESLTDKGVSGWTEANPKPTRLSELSLQESIVVDATTPFDLGNSFQPGATEDLVFEYLTLDNEIETGLVTYVGPPSELTLQVDLLSGEAKIQNLSTAAGDFDIIGYSITSESGSLSTDDWTTFADSGAAGEGWSMANPSAVSLAELNPTGVSALFDAGSSISLGNIFAGTEDLVFEYGTADGAFPGVVEYVLDLAGGEDGFDCNLDGVTDAADLACVATISDRDEVLDVLNTLPGDLDGDGQVAFPDFLVLSANFGDTTKTAYTEGDIGLEGDGPAFSDFLVLSSNFGQTAALSSVPEPSGFFLAGISLILLGLARRRHPGRCAWIAATTTLLFTTQTFAQDTVFFTGFEYDDVPVVFEPAEINGAMDQIGEWSGPEFPVGQGDILVFDGVVDTVGFAPSPFGGTLMVVDRPSGDFDTDEDVTGSYFADFSKPVGLLGAQVSFDVGTRRTQGNNEKDYDIIGRDSSGAETFHLRVGTNNNGGERLGVVVDDEVIFDLPTVVGEDGPADLDNMGGFNVTDGPNFGQEIANITLLLGADGFVVDFAYPPEATSGNANAYRTSLLSYNGEGMDLAQLEFTYEGSTANGRNSGYVLDNIMVTGFEEILQGDFNFDGVIDFADYLTFADNFGTGTTYAEGDFNFDGLVSIEDFVGLKAAFQAGSPAVAAVPEPTSGLLCLLACGLGMSTMRHRISRHRGLASGLLLVFGLMISSPEVTLAQPGEILGTGTEALLGGDLTDPEDDGAADEDVGYNAIFRANAEPGFGGGEFSFNVFDNLLGGGNAKWCCGDAAVLAEEGSLWVEAELESVPLILTHFTVSSANDVPNRDPVSWAILGSNDGENYETIFEYEGETLWTERLQVIQFTGGTEADDYVLPDAYRIFRMATFETAFGPEPSGAFFQIGEIEFFGIGDFTPGDFDDDGEIGFADFLILAENFGETFSPETSTSMGDFNGDLSVDLKDFAGFRELFNGGTEAGVAAVPEPSGHSIFGIASLLLLALRRRVPKLIHNPSTVVAGRACPSQHKKETLMVATSRSLSVPAWSHWILSALVVSCVSTSVRAAELYSEDFDAADGGLVATLFDPLVAANPPEGPWTWGPTGVDDSNGWTAEGSAVGTPFEMLLDLPPISVTDTGLVILDFDHRYNFEATWDGGVVMFSVNGDPLTPVPPVAFTANGYNDLMQSGADWGYEGDMNGLEMFGIDSEGFVTSTANLGTLSAGDTLEIQFRGGWDWGTHVAGGWTIDNVVVTQLETPGDFNFDGTLDFADFLVLAGNFNEPGQFADGDLNIDGIVNMADFVEWVGIFQSAPVAAAVPEPTSLPMLMLLLCTCGSRLRRHRVNV